MMDMADLSVAVHHSCVETTEAVLFDLDGTLIDFCEGYDPSWIVETIREEIERFGGDPEVPAERIHALFAEPGTDHFRAVCDDLGIEDHEAFWHAIQSRGSEIKLRKAEEGQIQLYDDVDILEELADRFELGLVSNQPQESVDDVLGLFGLAQYFSFQRGFPDFESIEHRKPRPGHLEEAIEVLGVDEAVFVGDNPEDVVAARRAGITPVYIDRGEYRKVEDVERIESLYELRDLLGL